MEDQDGEAEEEHEGERTLKGAKASIESTESVNDFARPSQSLSHRTASSKARLSSLFTDYFAPAPEASTSRIIPSAPIAVADPSDSSRRLSSFDPRDRMSVIDVGSSRGSSSMSEESEDQEDLDSALESLMVRDGPLLSRLD